MIDAVDRKGILRGYRTGRAFDVESLADILVSTSRLAQDTFPRLREMDLNPVIVTSTGAFAVDALVCVQPSRVSDTSTVLEV